jgi:hypothetical protein
MVPGGKFLNFASSIREKFERKNKKSLYDGNGELNLNELLENYLEKRKTELENKRKQEINYSNGTYSLILDGMEISKISIDETFSFIKDLKTVSQTLDHSAFQVKALFKGKQSNEA